MRIRGKLILSFLTVAAIVALSTYMLGCSSSQEGSAASGGSEAASMNLKIGASSQTVPIIESGKRALEEMGYTVEVVPFDDYQTPDRALDEGQLSCNFYQHKPFLEDFNSSNGTDLVMLEPVIWNFFIGLYSDKYDSLDDLPDGALIAYATDASNISSELEDLQSWGLLTLADSPSDGEYYTELDIVDNPKNIKFISVEDTQRYGTADEYDAYIGASDRLFAMGIDPNENLLAQQADDTDALGIAVRAEDADSQLAQDLIAAYTSPEAINYVNEELQGSFVLTDAAKQFTDAA